MIRTSAAPRTLDLRTHQVAFLEHGPTDSDAAPMVLLHGGGLDRRMWLEQLDAFGGRRIFALDARSHGATRAPNEPHRLGHDVVEFLDAFTIDRAVLVGLSMGGATAVDVALEYPDRVAALIVSGTGTSEPDFHDPWVLDILTTWQRAQAAGDKERWIEAFQRFAPGPHRRPEDVAPDMMRRLDEMVRDTLANHLRLDKQGFPIPPIPATPVTDTWARLPQIDVPVLAMVGSLDGEDHHRMAKRLADTVPQGEFAVVDNAAHYPNLESPQVFNDLIAEHLAVRLESCEGNL